MTIDGKSVQDIRILRCKEISARTGLCKAQIHTLAAAGEFPKPISLGGRAVGFLAHEFEGWLAARIAARDAKIAA